MALAGLAILPAPFVSIWPDAVRDVSAALSLARGEAFPLRGAPMNFGPHLGPASIWLMAIPLWVSASFTSEALFVATFAALRFVLVWMLARRLGGTPLALAASAAMAFPTVAVFEWHVMFNPDFVAPLATASLVLLAWAHERHSRGLFLAAFAALGLAVQMHGTALFYLPVHAYVAWRSLPPGRDRRLVLAGGLSAVFAWFLPVLWADHAWQAEEWRTLASAAAAGAQGVRPRDLLVVLQAAYWDIPHAAGEAYGRALGVPHGAWDALMWMALFGAAVGALAALWRPQPGRRAFGAVLGLLLMAWICTLGARVITPFWQCYFLLPLSALAMGGAFAALLAMPHAAGKALGALALLACIAMHAIAALGAVAVGKSGRLDASLRLLGDLHHPHAGDVTPSMWARHMRVVGAAARDDIARTACAAHAPVGAHGDLAYEWAGSTGLDFRLHCPAGEGAMQLFEAPGALQWTILTIEEARRLGREPVMRTGGIAVLPVRRSLHPPAPRAIERDWYYFERLRDRRPAQLVALEAATSGSEAILVQRLKPFDSRWEGLRVEADGQPVAAAIATFASFVFVAPGPGPHRWTIAFTTDAPQWVDVDVL